MARAGTFSAIGRAVAIAAAAACTPSYRVTPPAAMPPAVARVIVGPIEGVVVPRGMRLVAAYGDDAWQFAGHARSGPVVFGRVAVWDQHWIHVVDQRSGQPVAGVRTPSGAFLAAAAVDPTGTKLAALTFDGEAYYWPALDAPPVKLVPVPLAADASAGAYPDERLTYRPSRHSTREDQGAIKRAEARLAFSPDAARLLAGMHLWELSTGRDLVPLRADELVVDATFDDVTVARIGLRRHEGRPGSQCGFIPTWTTMHVVSLERRAPDHAPEVLVPSIEALPLPTTEKPFEDHAFTWIGSVDIADDGRVAYAQAGKGWLLHGADRRALRVDARRVDTSGFDAVTLGKDAIFAVVTERDPARSQWALYTLDARGGATTRVAGMSAAISRDGHAVVGRDGGLEAWTLSATPRGRDLDFRPKSLRSIDQGRAAAGGRVVLRDTAADASIFEVRDPGEAPRQIRMPGSYNGRWALSDDGSRLVAVTGGQGSSHLRVISLDDGRVLGDEHVAADIWAVAASAHVAAAADDRGLVHVWHEGRASTIDLSGRYDLASALAISPDEKHLAIATGRGRIYVVALD